MEMETSIFITNIVALNWYHYNHNPKQASHQSSFQSKISHSLKAAVATLGAGTATTWSAASVSIIHIFFDVNQIKLQRCR